MVLKIYTGQMDVFADRARDTWVRDAARRLYGTFPDHYAAMGATAEDLRPVVDDVAHWAHRHQVEGTADVTRLVLIAGALGQTFWADPRFQTFVEETLGNSLLPPSRRTDPLVRAVRGWLGTLWANDGIDRFGLRLADHVAAGAEALAPVLQAILPGHWALFSPEDNVTYLTWLRACRPEGIREGSAQELVYVACAMVHGAEWVSDPQVTALTHLWRGAETRADLAQGLRDLYGALAP